MFSILDVCRWFVLAPHCSGHSKIWATWNDWRTIWSHIKCCLYFRLQSVSRGQKNPGRLVQREIVLTKFSAKNVEAVSWNFVTETIKTWQKSIFCCLKMQLLNDTFLTSFFNCNTWMGQPAEQVMNCKHHAKIPQHFQRPERRGPMSLSLDPTLNADLSHTHVNSS